MERYDPAAACQRQSLASSHTYLSINVRSSLVDEDGYQRPVSYCVVEPSSECGEYEVSLLRATLLQIVMLYVFFVVSNTPLTRSGVPRE